MPRRKKKAKTSPRLSGETQKEHRERIRERIRAVVKLHEDHIHPLWERLGELYSGDHWEQETSDQERVVVNVCYAVINVIVPAVTHNYPYITIEPLSESAEGSDKILERALNQEWRRLRAHEALKFAIKDSLIFGTGWVKAGWRRDIRPRLRGQEAMEQDFEETRRRRDEEIREDPARERELPDDRQIWEVVAQTQPKLVGDGIFVERVSPFNIYVDPEAVELTQARFLIHRIVKPVKDVKENERYNSKVRNELKGDIKASQPYSHLMSVHRNLDERALMKDVERVTLYEYWDIQEGTFTVYTEGHSDPLYGPKPWPYDFLPFFPTRDHTVPDEFYGIGELEAIESLQKELNKTRSQMLEQRKQYNRKVVFKETAFYPQDIDQLRSDRSGVFVPVRQNVPLQEAFQVVEPPRIDAQLYQVDGTIKQDITEITSISEYQRGQLPEVRRTATEASLIESAASIRAQSKLADVEVFIAEVAKSVLKLIQQFYDEQTTIRADGIDGRRLWFELGQDPLFRRAELDVKVEAGSTQPRNESQRKSEVLDLYQAFSGNPVIDQQELARMVLREFRVPGTERLIQQQQPQQQGQPEGAPAEGQAAPPAGQGGLADLLGGGGAPPPEAAPAPEGEGGELDQLLAQLVGQGAPIAEEAF